MSGAFVVLGSVQTAMGQRMGQRVALLHVVEEGPVGILAASQPHEPFKASVTILRKHLRQGAALIQSM